MLGTLVLDPDLELCVAHVDSSRPPGPEGSAHQDLCLRLRQSCADEHEAGAGFLRRFRAPVRQMEHLTQLNQPTNSRMQLE